VRSQILARENEKEGEEVFEEIGYIKKTKLSTQFFKGPKHLCSRIEENASAILPKTPLELAAPKGAL
jgi:hypothetical protein